MVLITPPRQRMSTAIPEQVLKACGRLRNRVETVGSHLTECFAGARIRVRDLWHLQHRLSRKVLAHTVGVFLNLQLGRAPLDLDGLLEVCPESAAHKVSLHIIEEDGLLGVVIAWG